MMYHNPVMLKETIDCLELKEDGIYVDLTFGGGGHSKEILNFLSDKGKLLAFDQDIDAIENKILDDRFLLINQNFKDLRNHRLSVLRFNCLRLLHFLPISDLSRFLQRIVHYRSSNKQR